MHEYTDFKNIRDVPVALALKVPTKLVSNFSYVYVL
jgi:hypothetical protein